jgi:hypothetical protein
MRLFARAENALGFKAAQMADNANPSDSSTSKAEELKGTRKMQRESGEVYNRAFELLARDLVWAEWDDDYAETEASVKRAALRETRKL